MNYRRVRSKGGTYFFTVNLQNRSQQLLIEHINLFGVCMRKVRVRHPFQTLAIVVLPDHLHCIWQLPDGDDDFSTRWSLIKASFSRELHGSANHKGERSIWQKRFWEHLIRDEGDLHNHIDYIHNNPVKHGYVETPSEWSYSSWGRYYRDEMDKI
ncbi:transposase [Parendozoicomonas sp. Alg238-R29]|uniref:REP-associated tyrosine transposase n=1 Tax=Parendozoicomonas sp. Alg238-R29 TaxID=2993446 RepID=UPI00248E9A0A|nr:transposase [Parendozoicomonas sp. Alg238-R29]